MAGRRKAQHPANQSRSCARPKSIQLQKSTPFWASSRGRRTHFSGQPLASRVHRPGSGRARVLPTGPVVLRIGIHHVAPSLALPASLLLPLPSLLKYHPSHPSRGSFPVFWCELESWKWSSPLDRIKVEHRDEEGRYLVGAWNDRVFPPPHPYHLVSTRKIFLAPVCPACLCLACLDIYASSSNPLCQSLDYGYTSCDRRPATHGESRPYRRRTHWSSRRGCRMSCRLRQSFRICRGSRRKLVTKKPRIVTSIVFDHSSLPSRPMNQSYRTNAAGSQC